MNTNDFIQREIKIFVNRLCGRYGWNEENQQFLLRNVNIDDLMQKIENLNYTNFELASLMSSECIEKIKIKCLSDLLPLIENWVFLISIHAIFGFTPESKKKLFYILDKHQRTFELQKKFPTNDQKVDRILELSNSRKFNDEVELLTLQNMIE